MVAIPRVVLAPLLVEGAREESLPSFLDRLQVPEDRRQPVARAVLDGAEHLRLAVVVVRVEKVAVRPVLLPHLVAHHLDVLAEVIRQPGQIVRALLERPNLR